MSGEATGSDKKFSDYDLAADVLEALDEMGFAEPTPIQEKVIGPILERLDVVGKAETGTGKTIGFGAPLVGKVDTERVSVQALVLAPTRELAQQVAGVLAELGARRGLGVALIVGGVHASEQIERLRSGCQMVVGTPGRILEFLNERILSLAWCDTVVLDEADRMLDMGFIEDVSKILDKVPEERQTLLFSATLPAEVRNLLKRYMREPQILSTRSGIATVPEIEQKYVEVEFRRKFHELKKILDEYPDDTAIIFTNTRRQAIDLDRMMWGHGYSAGSLHGEQEQDVRFRILQAFRKGEIRILVATDVAARGLDIQDVARVINYEVPFDAESYVHRIGRTGRAQRTGIAITLVSSKEWRQWEEILSEETLRVEREGPERIRKSRQAGGSERRAERRSPAARSARRKAGAKGEANPRRRRSSRHAAEESPNGASRARAGGKAGSKDRKEEGVEKRAVAADVDGPARGQEGDTARRGRRGRRAKSAPRASEETVAQGNAGSRTERPPKAPRGGGRRRSAAPKVEFTPEEREILKKKPREKPEKKKLDEALDDGLIKLDYFEVSESAAKSPARRSRSRRGGRGRAEATEEAGEKAAGSDPAAARRRRRRRRKAPKKSE